MAYAFNDDKTKYNLEPKQIMNGTDLNDLMDYGPYYYLTTTGDTIGNYPETTLSNFTLLVMKKGEQTNQILINNMNNLYFRVQFTTGWQSWQKVTHTTV